ncbi:CBM96 family carbohydrate-binding protein [Kribbella sp. WER1]
MIPVVAGLSLLATTAGIGAAIAADNSSSPVRLTADSTPSPVSLTATADTYVQVGSTSRKYGRSTRLVVKRNQSTSLVRYVVPPVAPGYERKATLVLHRMTTSSPAKIAVSNVSGRWSESTTYANAPRPGTPFATAADDGRSTQLRIDVSKGITAAGELNLALTQPVGTAATVYGSREAGAKQTRLEIAYVRAGTGPTTSHSSTPTSAGPTGSPTTTSTPTQSPTSTPTTASPSTPAASNSTPTASPSTPGTPSTPPSTPPTTTPPATPTTTELAPSWSPTGSHRLTFDDEFSGTAVDTTKWETGWFKEGISDGVNSDNLQCYDSKQVTESGGFLNLTLAQRQATCRGGTKDYVSGLVNTRKSFSQLYGSFEARVCLPDANGDGKVDGFPAWWTNGPASVPWPDHGEIDVLEGISGGTKASLHYANPLYDGGTYSSTPLVGCHNFGSQWTNGNVTFYYDGKPLWSHAFNATLPQFLIFNYAIRQHADEAITPGSALRVDWVRVWA